MIGSVADMVYRMRKVLPPSWFPITEPDAAASITPVLDGLLSGIGEAWSYCYALMSFVVSQGRLSTASDSFLDMFCADFFGDSITRLSGESDNVFRSRISINLLRAKATREAVASATTTLLGRPLYLFEPFNAADTGGYGSSTNLGAGGGGGYGTAIVSYGSSRMPFQYLLTVNDLSSYTRRESAASFIDASGLLQIAPRHCARSTYSGATDQVLSEPRGVNLIKDSVGWSRWAPSAATGTCRWTIDPANADALWRGNALMKIGFYSGGQMIGPSVDACAGPGEVSGSSWIRIPANHRLDSLSLEILDNNIGVSVKSDADLTVVNRWQRLVVTSGMSELPSRRLSLQINASASGLMDSPVLTQCWQLEPGLSASSYIPSFYHIGIREADLILAEYATPETTVDLASLCGVVAQVSPAGSIAWTTIIA